MAHVVRTPQHSRTAAAQTARASAVMLSPMVCSRALSTHLFTPFVHRYAGGKSSDRAPSGYATTYTVAGAAHDFSFVTIRLAGHMVRRRA